MTIRYVAEPLSVSLAQLAYWGGSATADTLFLTGPCPRCEHPATSNVPRQTVALEQVAAPLPQTLTADFSCNCTQSHPGPPAGVTSGCGRTWFAAVTVAADGAVSLTPSPGRTDPALAAAAQALRAAGPKQLADVRNAAEKWIGGVAALFGLFGLAGVITSRSTLTSLAAGWQAAIAVAAAVAVALAGLAIYRIYRAAYGWPVTYPIHNDQELQAWYAAQQAAPRTQAAYLRDGVKLAGAALATLTIAVGFLLFAPNQTPKVSFVQVTLTDGSHVCGTLLPAATGTTLIRRTSDGTAVDIAARSITAETVVMAC